ncbi:hypothetical protein A3F57_04090 [Candidatus Roizmanbacteria bacterium RIFCSPHIGHO2_12_FULL_36_11]|nr:MAG: hypothetical protein A3F57_04090 [Candidatus Roizmanbacteria bacterium RIFCSPHIGHO2_12_FULL_36_11]
MEWKKLETGTFLVNVLAIIYNKKIRKILIGRRENDPYLKELTWCFPGGMPGYESDLETYLKEQIKIKTGLEIKVEKVIFAKTYPEKREFLSIYYICEPISGEEKAGELFVEIKWVKPMDVMNYFTTSIHPKLVEYLKLLT